MRVPFVVPPADVRPFDVVTLGENSIDLVAVLAEYPESNTKARIRRFAHLPGGQMATAAAICARLGWRARYIGSFGDDPLGTMARRSARRGRRSGCIIEDVLEYANAVAALNCRGLGAQSAMPTAADVERLLMARTQASMLDS